jgi:hypothetical protein
MSDVDDNACRPRLLVQITTHANGHSDVALYADGWSGDMTVMVDQAVEDDEPLPSPREARPLTEARASRSP